MCSGGPSSESDAKTDNCSDRLGKAAGNQTSPSVAWSGDNYYVAWQDSRNAVSTGDDIYLVRVSQFGSVIDPAAICVSEATYPESMPVVVCYGPDLGMAFYLNTIYSTRRLMARPCGESPATRANSVYEAKTKANGTRIQILSKVVTAGTDQIPGCFYIEEADRSSGIRVMSTDPIREGNVVDVTGTLALVDGERRIVATSVKIVAHSATVPKPVGTGLAHLGGTALNADTPGVKDGRGPNNIGLLVEAWGRVSAIGTGCFYIKDGSMSSRPKPLPPTPAEVKVVLPAGVAAPALNSYVGVVGISSCEPSGLDSVRRVLIRKASDITVK